MEASTPAWVKNAIFYQVFPDRFARSGRVNTNLTFEDWDAEPTPFGFKGGDLFGLTEKFDYLQSLGINAIYLNPIFSSACNHRYHTFDYFQVDPLLGGNAAFRELLDEAHARNIRVVIDGVFNHASRGFWQFHHVLENGAASPYFDWFHFDEERLYGRKPFLPYPSLEAQADLQAGKGSLESIGYSAWWNLPALPKFNTDTPAVREFLWNVATHWIEFGIDGWRLDVPQEIDDDEFWQEFRRRVKSINPEAYIVGEIWGEAKRWLKGDQYDAVMNYLVTAACLGFFGGDNLDLEETRKPDSFRDVCPIGAEEFADEIDRILNLYPEEIVAAQLNLLDSHDMPRFLTCVQNDVSAFRLAWLFVCCLPGAPCLYYGDEVGLDGGHDPACRKGFRWDEAKQDRGLFDFVARCNHIRHATPALRLGSYRRLVAEGTTFAAAKTTPDQSVVLVFNTSPEQQRLEIPVGEIFADESQLRDLLTEQPVTTVAHEMIQLQVPGRTGMILQPVG